MSPAQRRDSLLVLGLGVALFAWLAPRAGLHLDDHGFWSSFSSAGPAQLWDLTVKYVPGRNLYIPFFFALHRLCDGWAPAMHTVGLVFDLLNPVLVLLLARRLGAGPGAALVAAGLFLTWPNHGETHWWTSSIMMNVFSTTLVLSAVLAAGETRLSPRSRVLLACALYAAALFDYDQVYLLWIPLLAFARLRDPRLTTRTLAAAAGLFIALDALHLAARLFWPWSSGGRPIPRGDVFLLSLKHAATQTLAPLRRMPDLDSFPGGLIAAAPVALLLGALWVRRCARRWGNDEPLAPARLIIFGAAWWSLAYAPNLLWYISPRHNYLPSVGTSLIAAALASRLCMRQGPRPYVAVMGATLFALFSVSAWSDGLAWAESARLQERFAAAAQAPETNQAVFLVGAPKDVRTAPGFFHPREHRAALARVTGSPEPEGDVSIAPNRRGLFFGTQPELFGADVAPGYSPAARAAVYAFRDGDFEKVCAARLDSPGLPPRWVPLSGTCPGVLALRASAALVTSRSRGYETPRTEGHILESASLATAPGGSIDLILRWRAGKIPVDIAAYARLYDAAGREIYRGVYRQSPTEHEALWPLYNDERPASTWKPGEIVEERHRLRLDRPLSGVPTRLRLSRFSRTTGWRWAAAGTDEMNLERRSQ